MERIQVITIVIALLFLLYISRLIVKGKLREEYAIVWCVSALTLVIFSFWIKGLDLISKVLGILVPANMVFTACIFVIMIYLLHLSVVASGLHKQNKQMAQDIALLKEKVDKLDKPL